MRYDCDSITWIFNNNSRTSTLFENEQIHKDAAAKSDRLRVTSDYSLVIEKVSVEDVGQYTCRQCINGQQRSNSVNILSVIQMVQQKQKDKIILTCSVMDYNDCRHTVKWLNEGREEMLSDMKESYQSCSDTVTIPTSDRNWKENSEILKCKVTNSYSNEVQLFDFRIQFSGGKTGWVWLFVIRPLCLAVMIGTVLVINRWTKTKGNKTIEEESKTEDEEDLTPKRTKRPRNKPE
ncbi:uncharacterized protein LOC122825844 [Gambusia affinis]|uniref:uncharacterized protein LOC122825844 n=1 Tax=Gambusia affinis TaxID=33528 RepID=UPI001CDC7A76|nr:uncharacterized protein LOC122825844 [Gambusia affinis]